MNQRFMYVSFWILTAICILLFLFWLMIIPAWTIHGRGGSVPCEETVTYGMKPVLNKNGTIEEWIPTEYHLRGEVIFPEDYVIDDYQSIIDVIERLKDDPGREEANRVKRISLS